MHLQVGQIVRGSHDLHNTFKTLAPKGLVLKFHETLYEPIVKYVDGEYMYISEYYGTEPMDWAWDCLNDLSWSFVVVGTPISKIIRTKVLHDI